MSNLKANAENADLTLQEDLVASAMIRNSDDRGVGRAGAPTPSSHREV
jgi:hypothetical protein